MCMMPCEKANMRWIVYDLINVAQIHNKTIPSSDVLSNDTLHQLQTLANQHEFSLAYNASEPIRTLLPSDQKSLFLHSIQSTPSLCPPQTTKLPTNPTLRQFTGAIAGSTLASQILSALNSTITSPSHSPRLTLQLGAYASYLSFFGLAGLTSLPLPSSSSADSTNFNGIPDYASTMVFELITNTSVGRTTYPSLNDVSVRFLFHNGTASNTSAPQAYPLFGQSSTVLSWADFSAGMSKFAIGSQSAWCSACGNSTGVCASNAASTAPSDSSGSEKNSSGGISTAVAGVIGAMVTLAVVLGVEGLIMLIGGLRVASKKRLAASQNGTVDAKNG